MKRKKKQSTPTPIPVETDMERLKLAVSRLAVNQGNALTVGALKAYISLLENTEGEFYQIIEGLRKEKDELFGL